METKQKEKLFGAVTNRSRSPFTVDVAKLKKPFTRKKTVCWMFCTSCDKYLETDLSFAVWLLSQAGLELPADWADYYLETQNVCASCPKNREPIVRLKRI